MPAPTALNFSRTKGDTYAIVLNVKDSAGAAIDVTGYTFLLSVDPSPDPSDDTTREFQLTGTIVDGPNGQISFAPNTSQANQLEPGTYFYDIEQVDGSSAVRTIAKGQYIILPQITQ